MILLLLIPLTFQISTTRIRTKESHTRQANFDDGNIKTAIGQSNVYVLNITDAYDVDIYDGDEVIETPYLSLDNLNLEHLIVEDECIGFPKHPQLTEMMDFHLLNSTEDSYYTDIVTISDYKNLYLITQDLKLIQLKLNSDYWIATQQEKVIDIKQFLNITNEKIRTNALFSCPYGHMSCLIVTPYGGFWIAKFIDFDDPKADITPQYESTVILRKEINKISTFQNIMVVAAGEEGVDIYRFGQKMSGYERKVYLMSSIANTLMELPYSSEINIIGVKIQNTTLFVLDEVYGIFAFDIANTQKPVLLMKISIPRTVAFDIHRTTLIVIAETTNNLQYMLEIFINFEENTYYVNRVYVDGFSFRDIQMNDRYAFLIGEDAHMVIKHSIFNGFVKNNKELVRTFFEDQLIRFQLYSSIIEPSQVRYSQTDFYVGLSRQSLHVWKFNDYHAFLQCSFDSKTQKEYILKINATQCYMDDQISTYQQCQATQKLTITTEGSVIESDSLLNIIVAVSVSGFFLILIIVGVAVKWRKFVKAIRQKKDELTKLQQYGHFQEVEQNSKELQ